ncbi:hypothetical protein GOV07_05210 [Candidatus Woesearchaeota archaeon]|nr:hypothetical protein [Candidatus Woesearchaeota archaeon]
MFSYAKTKLGTFWRTKSSLMITLRRRLREAIRTHEDLEKLGFKSVEEAIKSGEVENLERKFKGTDDELEEEIKKLVAGEKLAIAGEERPFAAFNELRDHFQKAAIETHRLFVMAQNSGKHDAAKHISKVADTFLKVQHSLDRVHEEEIVFLKKDYNSLERAEKHERGSLQSLAFSYNEVMQLMDKAWDARSQTRKASHDIDELDDEATHAYDELKGKEAKLSKHEDLNETDLKRIEELAEKIAKAAKRVEVEIHAVLEEFLFIFKVIADLELHYTEDDESHIEKILAELKEDGFPEKVLETLRAHYAEAREHSQEALHTGVNAFRRMARLQG